MGLFDFLPFIGGYLVAEADSMGDLTKPRESTVRRLFALSMNRCAYAGCGSPILDVATNTVIGEVCHIHATSSDGPRFDTKQTPEERHGFDNLMLLCRPHHKVIDANENLNRFTPDFLREMKAAHEHKAQHQSSSPPLLTEGQLRLLTADTTRYEDASVHMDFRGAIFEVGGRGGNHGAGGGGGVMTIVGHTKPPPESRIELDGRSPGGGGGAINYVGRAATKEEVQGGLRISSMMFVSSYDFKSGLGDLKGAGWEWCTLDSIPREFTLCPIFTVEFTGTRVPEDGVMFRFGVDVIDPKGRRVLLDVCDIGLDDNSALTPRRTIGRELRFQVDSFGIWSVQVKTGDSILAEQKVELRPPKRKEERC